MDPLSSRSSQFGWDKDFQLHNYNDENIYHN